jgi:hypothetical protein
VWDLGLLLFPGPDKDYLMLPFDELLKQLDPPKKVSRRTEGGKEFVVVEYSYPETTSTTDCEAWFDPQANYLVWRSVIKQTSPGLRVLAEHRVLRFKEVAPGLFFPEEVEQYDGAGGSLRAIRTASFTDIRVNQPLPRDVFHLPFPPGIVVIDVVQGKSYTMGADGKPTGPIKDLPQQPPSPPAAAEVEPLGATLEEPKSWTRWVLPASAAVLVLAAGLWAKRKWNALRGA